MSERSAVYLFVVLFITSLAVAVTATAQSNNPRIVIEKTQRVVADSTVQVTILYQPGSAFTTELGYFNLLVQYDTSAATLQSVQAGASLASCGWEAFSWSAGSNADCGGVPCVNGVVRITAQADLNNGPPGPSCLINDLAELAVLTFHTSVDSATWECQFSPIQFVWYGCGDNVAMASVNDDSVYISDHVYDNDNYTEITQDLPFPTAFGAPGTCVPDGVAGKVSRRAIDFERGGLNFLCVDSVDFRGDINLDGRAYTVPDQVLLTNYFVYGLSVFGQPELQEQASDVNANGIDLELDDLVYLFRVVSGDAVPFPRPAPSPATTAIVTQDGAASTVTVEYPGQISAAWFVFGGDIQAISTDTTNPAISLFDSLQYTRVLVGQPGFFDSVLVYFPPTDTGRVILNYTGSGTLIHAELSSDGVQHIPVSLQYANVPSCCQLRGNVNGYGAIDVADLTALVAYLFQGAFLPPPCPEQADVDGSGGSTPLNVADLTYLVHYLFQNGPPPPACS